MAHCRWDVLALVAKRTSNRTKATDRHYFVMFQGTRFIGFEKDAYLSSMPKGLRILDAISWLPEAEVRKSAFILRDDKVVAVIGYKE